MEELRGELAWFLRQPQLADAVLAVFASKQDLPGALSGDDVAAALGLARLPAARKWRVHECTATDPAGLRGGLEMVNALLAGR